MYVKRIDTDRIHCLKRPYLVQDGRIYTNPTSEQMRKAGYKPLIERPCPKEISASFCVYYEEDENAVYLCYRKEVHE